MVEVAALGFCDQNFRKSLESLDGRLGILLGDVHQDRPVQPLCIRFAGHRDDLLREGQSADGDRDSKRQDRERPAVLAHSSASLNTRSRFENRSQELNFTAE